MYHISFPTDSKTLKATVYTIIFDCPNIRRVGCAAIYFASQYPIDKSEVALMTQAVYAHRIWIVTQIKFISISFVVVRKSQESSFPCSFAHYS